jgi:coproporphyrinogen III oxidase
MHFHLDGHPFTLLSLAAEKIVRQALGLSPPSDIASRQARARDWFEGLQSAICLAFENLEDQAPNARYPGAAGRFTRTPWKRPQAEDQADQGGGLMGMMRGRLFEKVGVHTSTVHGAFAPDFAAQVRGAATDPRFWASGISVIAHMKNPRIPAVHMNTRMIVTTQSWFGGGADLNPTIDAQRDPAHPDAKDFHRRLKATCDAFAPDRYEQYSQWAEKYFWLPHRDEPRGVGGIFYDHLEDGDWESDFAFTQSVGQAFLDIYPALVRRHMDEPWSAAELEQQAKWRSRYVEFNLLYDRGTTFGLKTGGNVESILSSMPPSAQWP